MYSKEQASALKQAFWTAFGQYMSPIISADGAKVNWINYKTGVKNLYFRMQGDQVSASIAIEITHDDTGIQELFFEQLLQLKNILHSSVGEEWDWQLHTTDDFGKIVTRISKTITGVNVFENSNWPQLISFFKPRIISLDKFWSDARYSFEDLR